MEAFVVGTGDIPCPHRSMIPSWLAGRGALWSPQVAIFVKKRRHDKTTFLRDVKETVLPVLKKEVNYEPHESS